MRINSLPGEKKKDVLVLGTLERCLPSDARSAPWKTTGKVGLTPIRVVDAHVMGQPLTSYQYDSSCKSVAVRVQLVVEDSGHSEVWGVA